MALTRRRFLKWSMIWASLGRTTSWAAEARKPAAEPGDTLGAWLDTLIPADQTPSATQLGIDKALLATAADDSDYRALLTFGRLWLDLQARKRGLPGFASLGPEEREAVAAHAAKARPGSGERRFFEITRAYAFTRYYQHPASWPGLGYRGPPQPLGYMDYSAAPKRSP
jgi:hypothetical protein